MRDDSDESLMLRYRDGDVRAVEGLGTRPRKPVVNFILRFVRDTAQAEDVTQETFLRLVKGADAYERQAKFTTWLYTIARNLCVDASRRAVHRRAASLDAPLRADEPDGRRLASADALAMAPESEQGFVLVPPIVENLSP